MFHCSLRVPHDGVQNSCDTKDQFVMAKAALELTDQNYMNAYHFSPCSISAIRTFIYKLEKYAFIIFIPRKRHKTCFVGRIIIFNIV